MTPFEIVIAVNLIGLFASLIMWRYCFVRIEWAPPYTTRDERILGYFLMFLLVLQCVLFGAGVYGIWME